MGLQFIFYTNVQPVSVEDQDHISASDDPATEARACGAHLDPTTLHAFRGSITRTVSLPHPEYLTWKHEATRVPHGALDSLFHHQYREGLNQHVFLNAEKCAQLAQELPALGVWISEAFDSYRTVLKGFEEASQNGCVHLYFSTPHAKQHGGRIYPLGYEGAMYLLGGDFKWWPISVNWSQKPWPKEVPVLQPENICMGGTHGPDARTFGEWLQGFPPSKRTKVLAAFQAALKKCPSSFTGPRWSGNYTFDRWSITMKLCEE